MGKKVRVEVTFQTDKHADILEAMKKFGNQAGFLKFAAAHYVNTIRGTDSTASIAAPELSLDTSGGEPKKHEQLEKKDNKRRLPAGFGNQAISARLDD